ncbi:FAD-binding PCMH-type domain-containing protein [Mycena venus]|uniref:FAD-binding PCMH-type domain-containing protein n=1 Tax=Mycena venus TaxID=2733690 RepID=A0A8H6U0Y2_9AGAR|nr:FAD-binding PCMH-type domain-containing protein [Mycena venus]
MAPRDIHCYRIAGFGIPNWGPVLHAHCCLPKTPPPPIELLYPRFDGNLVALKAWRDLYLNDIYSAAIDALGLDEDPTPQKLLIIYLRCSGESEISKFIQVENAFVFSLEEAATMLAEVIWKGVKSVVNGRPQTSTHAAADPAPCVVCQMIDPIDPGKAPAFMVSVKLTDTLLEGARRKDSWKTHLVETLGGGVLRMNLTPGWEGVLH